MLTRLSGARFLTGIQIPKPRKRRNLSRLHFMPFSCPEEVFAGGFLFLFRYCSAHAAG